MKRPVAIPLPTLDPARERIETVRTFITIVIEHPMIQPNGDTPPERMGNSTRTAMKHNFEVVQAIDNAVAKVAEHLPPGIVIRKTSTVARFKENPGYDD